MKQCKDCKFFKQDNMGVFVSCPVKRRKEAIDYPTLTTAHSPACLTFKNK